MKTISTKNFGELEYDPQSVITFAEGLPGFDDLTKYILLTDEESEGLFHWLQSVEDGDLVFVLLNVKQIMPDYEPTINAELLDALLAGDENAELFYYNIAVVPEDVKQMRVNLKAPIIINESARSGMQVLAANEEYSIRHYIFNALANTENSTEDSTDREDKKC
ncbi:MAG: flagellar assembly protein FliW [Turicibacter sp.]|nr:flagellar assembly protein FliW [Turicibacter sp.]